MICGCDVVMMPCKALGAITKGSKQVVCSLTRLLKCYPTLSFWIYSIGVLLDVRGSSSLSVSEKFENTPFITYATCVISLACYFQVHGVSSMTLGMVRWPVGPTLWCGLKHLDNYWIDCHETFYRPSQSPQDGFFCRWWFPDHHEVHLFVFRKMCQLLDGLLFNLADIYVSIRKICNNFPNSRAISKVSMSLLYKHIPPKL